MATLTEIDNAARQFADAHAVLAAYVRELNDAIEAARLKFLPEIKRQKDRAARRHGELRGLIEDSAELFVKPRTITLHGVRVGFVKAKGRIEWDDDDQVVKLIRKHFPEQFDVLVSTVEKPVKKALAQLSAQELKRLAINVTETGDEVMIKDTASDVDKLVDALLKEATRECA